MLRLAVPLILSNSFWTIQITADRVLLGWQSSDAVGAAMMAAMLFWTPLMLLQGAAGYAVTFVSQYVGAGRNLRVGPAVWQALYLSVLAGLAFLLLLPLAPPLVALGGHSPAMQELEATYFVCLCFAALPMLIVAAASSFFAGRGDSWTVLLINAAGTVVNVVLDYVWIYGKFGFPALGIAGAGWATVAGSWVSALLALALLLRPKFRAEYATLSGWRFDRDLFRRLLRFGLPNGLQMALDGVAFTLFILLLGRMGDAELSASSIAFTINLVAFLPMLGVAQAVTILVGQRLGEDRPDLAEKSTWTGFWWAWLYMAAVGLLYFLVPGMFLAVFRSDEAPEKWAAVSGLVPVMLRFVALYCLFDSMNLVFSFALKGAGDTLFVTVASLLLGWLLLVLPTYAAWRLGWGWWWAWSFATLYVIALAGTFGLRFRAGKWKAMRVIEPAVLDLAAAPLPVGVED